MLRINDVTDKDPKLTKKREKYEKRMVENDKEKWCKTDKIALKKRFHWGYNPDLSPAL